MKSSTTILSAFVLVLSIQPFSSACTCGSTLDIVCRYVDEQFNVVFQFFPGKLCTETLSTDPRSLTANYHGLAVIAANITLNKATAIISKIESLLQTETGKETKKSLEACLGVYSDKAKSVMHVVSEIQAKHYDAALHRLGQLSSVEERCDGKLTVVLGKDSLESLFLTYLARGVLLFIMNSGIVN